MVRVHCISFPGCSAIMYVMKGASKELATLFIDYASWYGSLLERMIFFPKSWMQLFAYGLSHMLAAISSSFF